jgi:multiple sugar transport system permease protein
MSSAIVRTRPSSSRRRKPSRTAATVARFVGIALVVAAFLIPLIWMLLASLKSNLEIIDPSRTLDFTPTLTNYDTVFGAQAFTPFIVNSFIVGAGATLIGLIIGVPAAYGIARYKIKNATAFVLLARVIPGVSLLIPWYFLFAQIQLVGTYTVLILTHVFVTMPLVVAIMASFFEGIPEDLEEAAQIDGSSRIGAFVRVVLPLSVPGIATATILSFIFSWNNFLFALVLSNQDTRTLPVAISNFTSYAAIDWGGLMAASVVITVPVMLIALLAQKYVVSGLTAGATKG